MKTIALNGRPFIMNTHPFLVSAGARLRRVLTSVLLFGLAFGAGGPAARAADANPPDRMTYQGYLADANGNPLAPTTPVNYDVVFRIYSDQTGGALIWAEKQTVTVDKGQFSVVLGEGSQNASEVRPALNTVFGSATASDRYLDLTVTVGTTALNIAPRLRLVTSPYAFLASRVSGAGVIAASNLEPALANGLWTVSGANVYRPGGRVGIGTASPDGALDVEGYVRIQNGGPATGLLCFGNRFGNGYFDNGIYRGGVGSLGAANFLNLGSYAGIAFNSSAAALGAQATRMYIDGGSGNVGIGTSSPGARLHVEGGNAYVSGTVSSGGRIFSGGPGSGGIWVDGGNQQFVGSVNSSQMGLYNGAAWRMVVDNSGNVGIGTTAPRVPLEVVGSGADTFAAHYTYASTGVIPATSFNGTTYDVSIKANSAIHAAHFRAVSDARIKKIQRRSDGAADLATLSRVEITDYTHIDVTQGGNRPNKKVIGQQVEGIFPQAVSKTTDVVPDIYQKATVKDGWVQLATGLKVGERVRLIGEKQEGIHEVLEVRAGAFRTALQPAAEKVFVYGREVKDFRVVDYEAIAMLNVSATQELARRLAKVEQRESNLSALEEKAARIEKVERELAELKLLVARMAAQRPVGRPAAEAGPTSVNPAAQQ